MYKSSANNNSIKQAVAAAAAAHATQTSSGGGGGGTCKSMMGGRSISHYGKKCNGYGSRQSVNETPDLCKDSWNSRHTHTQTQRLEGSGTQRLEDTTTYKDSSTQRLKAHAQQRHKQRLMTRHEHTKIQALMHRHRFSKTQAFIHSETYAHMRNTQDKHTCTANPNTRFKHTCTANPNTRGTMKSQQKNMQKDPSKQTGQRTEQLHLVHCLANHKKKPSRRTEASANQNTMPRPAANMRRPQKATLNEEGKPDWLHAHSNPPNTIWMPMQGARTITKSRMAALQTKNHDPEVCPYSVPTRGSNGWARSTKVSDGARPTRIKQGHGHRVAKGGLLAVLANKLICLVLIPDTNMTNTIMSAIRAIDEEGNPGEIVSPIDKMAVQGPDAKCLLPRVRNVEKAASSTHHHRAFAIMLLGILGTLGAHEQAWPFPLEPPLCKPCIPNKPKNSGMHTRGDNSFQSNNIPMNTWRGAARNGTKAPRDVMPPGSFMSDAGDRTRCRLSFETLEDGTLEQLLYLFYSLVVTLLKRQASDL